MAIPEPHYKSNFGRRVLLVEDDLAVATMYRLKLEIDGYLVRLASDGPTGFAMAKEFFPDVAVIDMRLPGMNGLALLDALREDTQTSGVVVMMLTSDEDPEVERMSLLLGARAVLLKRKTTPSDLSRRLERPNPMDAAAL